MELPNKYDFIYFNELFEMILNPNLVREGDEWLPGDNMQVVVLKRMIECYNRIDIKKFENEVFNLYDSNRKALKIKLSDYLIDCFTPFYNVLEKYKENDKVFIPHIYCCYNDVEYTLLGILGMPIDNEIPVHHYYLKLSYTKKIIYKYYPELKNDATPPRKPQQIQLSENLLNDLEKEKLITKEPLKWTASKALFAYFIKNVYEKADNECVSKYKSKYKNNPFRQGEKRKIKIFEEMFDTKGLTAAINENNKTEATPIGHEKIDEIIKKSTFIL